MKTFFFPYPNPWGQRPKPGGAWAQGPKRALGFHQSLNDTSDNVGPVQSGQPGLLRPLISRATTENSKAAESRQPSLN